MNELKYVCNVLSQSYSRNNGFIEIERHLYKKKKLESLPASVVRTYGYYFANVIEFIGKQKT